jgi:hypothetical protein
VNAKSILQIIGCAGAFFALTSCGSTNPGPGVAAFKTVTVSGSALTPLPPVSLFATTTCSNDVHTGIPTLTNTPLTVTLTSTLYPKANVNQVTTGQPVTINGGTISYQPLNGGPAISDPVGVGFTGTILPGGTLAIPVSITSFRTEGLLQNDANLSKCAAFSDDYEVTITFFGTELGGTNANIIVHTTLSYTNSLS